MKDLIERQAAIDGVKTLHDVAWKNWQEPTLSANVVLDMIMELPAAQPDLAQLLAYECGKASAQPERKKGRWIEDHKLFGKGPTAFKCSVCGTIGIDCDDYKFCHMCGADMRGEQDESIHGI